MTQTIRTTRATRLYSSILNCVIRPTPCPTARHPRAVRVPAARHSPDESRRPAQTTARHLYTSRTVFSRTFVQFVAVMAHK